MIWVQNGKLMSFVTSSSNNVVVIIMRLRTDKLARAATSWGHIIKWGNEGE